MVFKFFKFFTCVNHGLLSTLRLNSLIQPKVSVKSLIGDQLGAKRLTRQDALEIARFQAGENVDIER